MSALAALLLLQAAQYPAVVQTTGIGLEKCSVWNDYARSGGEGRNATMQWVLGFVTGAEMSRVLLIPNANAALDRWTSPHAMIAFMDDYCRRDPNGLIGQGAQDLYADLMANANGRR